MSQQTGSGGPMLNLPYAYFYGGNMMPGSFQYSTPAIYPVRIIWPFGNENIALIIVLFPFNLATTNAGHKCVVGRSVPEAVVQQWLWIDRLRYAKPVDAGLQQGRLPGLGCRPTAV